MSRKPALDALPGGGYVPRADDIRFAQMGLISQLHKLTFMYTYVRKANLDARD
jgi:hypothetical protein